MKDEQVQETISYFDNKILPADFEMKGFRINNCRTFVDAQVLRIKVGIPLIRQVSYDHLVSFRKELEKL